MVTTATPPLRHGLASYVLLRSAYFIAVRTFLHLADSYNPGTLQLSLRSSGLYRCHLTRFYGRTLLASYFEYVIFDALHMFFLVHWLPVMFRSKKLSEYVRYKALLSYDGHLLVPDFLLRFICWPADELADSLYAVRRRMTTLQIMQESFICERSFVPGVVDGLRCGLDFIDNRLVPALAVGIGSWLGACCIRSGVVCDVDSGTTYNVAHACMFVVSNSWLIFRMAGLPMVLKRCFPALYRVEVYRPPENLINADHLCRMYHGRTLEELAQIERNLREGLYVTDRPTPEQEKILLMTVRRQQQRVARQIDHVRANTVVAVSGSYKTNECCICLSNFDEVPEIRAIRGCGHTFCSPCIVKWLLKEDRCPLCKTKALVRRPWTLTLIFFAIRIWDCWCSVKLTTADPDFFEAFPHILYEAFCKRIRNWLS
ncbi:putative RING finger protein P4H10.07 [Diplonema papillatum]|nr:putative RING finger protein P4H10.07 [Diplonema papillatum]